MYIQNIKLQNYRNFAQLNGEQGLRLGRKVTLLIGKNGAGKSNLISALKQSLSFIFSKNKNIVHRNFIADSIQSIRSFETTDATRQVDTDGRQMQTGQWPIRIEIQVDIDEETPLNVVFERESLSSGIKESYSAAAVRFWNRYERLENLPVMAFYSDSFPHEKVTVGKKIQDLLNSEFGISKPAGYYNWDDPRDCSNVWQQFFAMQWKNFKFGHDQNHEAEYLRCVTDCMKRFSQPLENAADNLDFQLTDLTVVARGKSEVVVLRFANGMESDFYSLPAGYRRAFSMAFDMANRAFLLNANCNPEGIAFVDEVDLHLHPSLAQEILERLQLTFPRMQFVVSTHSPLVLSNFRPNGTDCIIYRLSRTSDFSTVIDRADYSYGIDYGSLLTDLMDTKVRNTVLRKLIDSYLYWKSADEEKLAEKELLNIVDLVGEHSPLVEKLRNR